MTPTIPTRAQNGYSWLRTQRPFRALYVSRRGKVRFLGLDGKPQTVDVTEPGWYPIAGLRLLTRRKTVMLFY